MFGIIGGLFGGWVLGLFGFKSVVVAGMLQVFGVTLNTLGYYFLFAMMGAIKSVGLSFNRNLIKLNQNDNNSLKELLKNKQNKR